LKGGDVMNSKIMLISAAFTIVGLGAGFFGGMIWCVGMSFNIIASGKTSPAIAYGLGQGATVVAAIWGIFIWKEFKNAPKGTFILINTMLVLYIAGLMLIILTKI
jgi:glucose uptake protein